MNLFSLLKQEKDNLQKDIFKELYEFFSYTGNVWYGKSIINFIDNKSFLINF